MRFINAAIRVALFIAVVAGLISCAKPPQMDWGALLDEIEHDSTHR